MILHMTWLPRHQKDGGSSEDVHAVGAPFWGGKGHTDGIFDGIVFATISRTIHLEQKGLEFSGCFFLVTKDTFPETNSSHLKMGGWNTSFLLGWPIFRGKLLVSGSVHVWKVSPSHFFVISWPETRMYCKQVMRTFQGTADNHTYI